ncbi:MAG TPA: hypothetical protein DEA75_09735 [Rhodobacteraceae bacterium]|nr:hypothetical protein [Paracoccaceae bacterium]
MLRFDCTSALGGSYPSHQFHCLAKLITLQTNISLCGAYMMGIVSLLPAFFYFISIGNRLLFLQVLNKI